ncbi:glycosyltransferase, partial [bacterium]|nr:glycosyltransferase [bacterium]
RVLVLGHLPPPYFGPAIATEILLSSSLKERFKLYHLDTNVHQTLCTLNSKSFKLMFKRLCLYFQFLKYLFTIRPQIVLIPISQTTSGFLKDSGFIMLGYLFRRRIVLHLRGSNFGNWVKGASSLTRRIVRLILKRVHGVIVLGATLRGLFDDYVIANRIFVVPNGRDFVLPKTRRNSKNIKLLYLGNLQPSKGIEDVIEALCLLKDKSCEKLAVDIVGQWRDSATQKRCQDLCREHQLPITFHPPVSGTAKAQFFSNADIFVFTPREPEGHPWVIIEALAAGIPIISTDQGAIKESVRDGFNGFLVKPHDPTKLAAQIKRLIIDKKLRDTMSKNACAHYKRFFTEAKMVENLTLCFETVLRSSTEISPNNGSASPSSEAPKACISLGE